jgi:hypothetical protein
MPHPDLTFRTSGSALLPTVRVILRFGEAPNTNTARPYPSLMITAESRAADTASSLTSLTTPGEAAMTTRRQVIAHMTSRRRVTAWSPVEACEADETLEVSGRSPTPLPGPPQRPAVKCVAQSSQYAREMWNTVCEI